MADELHPPGHSLQVILLDIDGTLIDSNDAHARAWTGALHAHGYKIPFGKVRSMIGKGGDKLLPELTGLDPESGEATRIGETRGQLFRRELPSLSATRGARDLLQLLTARGFELVVATSAQEDEVSLLLEQAEVADLIHAAASAGDAERSKPDPDIVQAALRKAHRSPSHSILIGDTPYDIEASAAARVPSIILRCGGWWPDDALGGALAIYDDPAELCRRIDDSPLRASLTV